MQESSGKIVFDLARLGYDRLAVGGKTILGGKLTFNTYGAAARPNGTKHTVLTTTQLTRAARCS